MTDVLCTITQVAREVGCTPRYISDLVEQGKLHLVCGKISSSDFLGMKLEKDRYISLREYALSHDSERFQGKKAHDRDALCECLITHDYYGVRHYDPTQLLYGDINEAVYFSREDVNVLDQHLKKFFIEYGLSEAQKVFRLMEMTEGHERTKEALKAFTAETFVDGTITPSYTEFVEAILQRPDITCLTAEQLNEIVKQLKSKRAKKYLKKFNEYSSRVYGGNNVTINVRQNKGQGLVAYKYDTVVQLFQCIFNESYNSENKMIEKAIANPLFAEAWLFHALCFTCAQRASDIARSFCYLDSRKYPKEIDISWESLAEDILSNKISEDKYEAVCQYSVKAFEISGFVPSKISEHSPPPLRAAIFPELYSFFGKLILIAESHHRRNGKGYMKPERFAKYNNRLIMHDFYGKGMDDALKGQNLQTIRLNKAFLQAIEKEARDDGCGSIKPGMIASFARSHKNLNTIKAYLQDHTFESLTPEDIMFFMMEREAFGFEAYNTLVTAYPDEFTRLPIKAQNEIMKKLQMAPLNIEIVQSGIQVQQYIQNNFLKGKVGELRMILKQLFEISQGRGRAKDEGIYCTLRAINKVCINPAAQSCIASCCEYSVFTAHGYYALLAVLKDYYEEARHGNRKAESVLNELLMPRYRNILNNLMDDVKMAPDERQALKLMMKEYFYGC